MHDTIGVMRALRITFLLPLIANAASAKGPQEGAAMIPHARRHHNRCACVCESCSNGCEARLIVCTDEQCMSFVVQGFEESYYYVVVKSRVFREGLHHVPSPTRLAGAVQ